MDVKVHRCISQEMVAQGVEEPPAKKCNCRLRLSYKEANALVKYGSARWVVTGRERGQQTEPCHLCKGDKEVKNCANCAGLGTEVKEVVWETFGKEIVYVSQSAVDPREKKYRPKLAMKTPRVATIESEHITRAYIDGNREAQERIEEYGRLILDARAFIGLNRIPAIGLEPGDNEARGEGRMYDFGRAV